ncbi:MAG: single-stranded DNA-binding protein [Clostridiales bacterium]|jgi:single-strand DNA-binding protein|nr:single-stranded DNA-binding protein [Clostridiales bacterium]
MNKVILMGRLTKDPEIRYSSAAEPLAIARYTLAVNRRFRREGEPEADFINCVTFGKSAEFAEKWFKKGQMVAVSGRLQIRTFDNEQGQRQWFTEVILDDQYFAESRASFENRQQGGSSYDGQGYNQAQPQQQQRPPAQPQNQAPPASPGDSFFEIDNNVSDDDLPF